MSELVLENKSSNGWIKTNLEMISNITTGNSAPQSEEFFKNGTYSFVRVADMGKTNTVYLNDTKDHVNELGAKKLKMFPKGSVLFTKSGASTHLNQKSILGMDSYVVSHIGIINPLGKIPSEFIYYFLKTIDFKTLTHESVMPSLQLSKIKTLDIFIPPLNEQKRIVAKIEELFSLIEFNLIQLDRVVRSIITLEKSVLSSAFSGKLTQKWRIKNKDLINFNYEKIIEVENVLSRKQKFVPVISESLPVIPKDWHWTRMSVVCSKVTDGTHFSPPNTLTGDFQYITAKNIKSWGIDLSKITYVTKQVHSEIYSRCNPEKGDVLYIKDGVTTGLSAVNELDYPFTMLSSLALLKPNKEILNSYFLKHFLNNSTTFKRLTGRMTGTAIKRIILEKIRDAEIPIPSLEEQKETVKEIDRYFSLTKNMKKPIMGEIKRLTLLKNSILKQAFEGKLVPQDPNDEPAEILLQKIKQEKQKINSQTKRGKKNDK